MFKVLILLTVIPIQYSFAQDLIETYQLALENNPDLKNAYLRQLSATELKSQSIAQMLPTISLVGASARRRLNSKKANYQSSGVQNYWNHSFNINFKQAVFNWSHWIELFQSDNKIAQSEAQYQANYQVLLVKISKAYFNILAAQDNLKFTISEKKAIEQQLKQAKQRFAVGLIAMTDVYEAQASYNQSIANEIEAINLLDNSKEDLTEIMGKNEAKLKPLLEDIPLNLPEPADITLWSKVAEKNNFNIISQLNQTEVARKEIKRLKGGHLPTIDIIARYGVQDDNSNFGLRGDTQNVALQLNLPLFSGGGVHSRVTQAQLNFQQEKENLIKIKRLVARQVKNTYRNVVSSISRVKALQATVKSSASALEATMAGLQVGTRTMVDVLAEQRNLYRSKRDYSKSRYDYLINGIKLKEAAGSLTEGDLQQINQYLKDF